MNRSFLAVGAAAFIVAAGQPAVGTAAPAVGDAYVYQVVNGYSKEVRGRVHYQVTAAGSDRVVVSVSPDSAAAGAPRTEIDTPQGNWLRRQVESHGMPVDYEFATAYPAFVFPLDPGKTWSVRVNATVPGATRARSVRVDGQVIANERVRVPAGEFDTVKIRRLVYPGDASSGYTETRITEFDWYAPALGRVVRSERRSEWKELFRCPDIGHCDYFGDWSVLELVESGRPRS